MPAGPANSSRPFIQIALLGVIWGAAAATLVTRGTAKRTAGIGPIVLGIVDISRVPLGHCSLEVVSFRSRAEGWVTDSCGKAFHSIDGGLSFEQLPAGGNSVAVREDDDTYYPPERVKRIEWLSDRRAVAFVSKEGLAMATSDGGATWQRQQLPVSKGQELHVGEHPDRLAGVSRWGDDGTVTLQGHRLIFRVGEQLVRETPLVGAAPPAREIIRGREPLEPGHTVVWTDNAIVETFDDGRSWSTFVAATDQQIGDRPWTPGRDRFWRVVHPRPGKRWGGPLVELADGTVLRELGHALVRSEQPEFDRFTMDMIEAHRRGDPTPPGPFDCLATSASGRITFEIIRNGDCHASKHEAKLSWGPQGASLDPWVGASSPITLTNDQRIDLVRAIANAAHRPDDTRHGSNDHLSVVLDARCGDGPPMRAEFDQSDTGEPGTPFLIEQELIRHMRLADERK